VVIESCASQLAPVITHLFNLSLSQSSVPSTWKHSTVVPVPKISHPKKESDFRPISVTPLLSRVFEKLFVRDYFFPSLPNEILANQFAFRPTGSTTVALISFTHNVAELLEESPYVRCVLVDFSRDFDIVRHLVLFQKLQRPIIHRELVGQLSY